MPGAYGYGYGAGRHALSQGVFSLGGFLAAQADGFDFDWAKTDRHFQEPLGPTLADDVGEAIGLALDQRMWAGQTLAQIISAAPELCVNGGFDIDLAGWTDASSGTTVTWSAGRASLNAGGTARLRQGIAITAGRVMRFAGAVVSGSVAVSLGSAAGGTQYANQVASPSTVLFATTSGATFWIGWYGAGPTLVDDNSVREVSRYSALQASGTLKPIRQAGGGQVRWFRRQPTDRISRGSRGEFRRRACLRALVARCPAGDRGR